MSARKIQSHAAFEPVLVSSPQTCLSLAPRDVCIRKSGVEFLTTSPIAPWTEMTVSLEAGGGSGRVKCNGVVVSCAGDKHQGYVISMLFTGLSRQAQARLNQIAFS
jgi:hypothetical protein